MAYLNLLLSAPESQVELLRQDATFTLKPTKTTGVSHLLGYWGQDESLKGLLSEALDGGEIVNKDLWHPLRSPIFHDPASVKSLHAKITKYWNKIGDTSVNDENAFDWYHSEMSRLLPLFEHAASRDECVVSILEPPADRERADRVRMPFESPTKPSELDLGAQLNKADSNISMFSFWRWALFLGTGVIGAIGLCLWRYRRMKK